MPPMIDLLDPAVVKYLSGTGDEKWGRAAEKHRIINGNHIVSNRDRCHCSKMTRASYIRLLYIIDQYSIRHEGGTHVIKDKAHPKLDENGVNLTYEAWKELRHA